MLQHLATHWLNTNFSIMVHFQCRAMAFPKLLIDYGNHFGFPTYPVDIHHSPCIDLVEHNIKIQPNHSASKREG